MKKEVNLDGCFIEDKLYVEEKVFFKCSGCGKDLLVDINLECVTIGVENKYSAGAYCEICDKCYEFPATLSAKLCIDFENIK